MSRREKHRLARRLKVLAVCGAVIYLVVGTFVTGCEYNGEADTHTGTVNQYGSGNIPEKPEKIECVPEVTEEPEEIEYIQEETEEVEIECVLPEAENITFSSEESEILAKIAMAEAEGEDTEGKALVMLTVMNRAAAPGFENSIKGVVFENHARKDGVVVWQFSSVGNGRYDRVTPNDDCYEALNLIKRGWDESYGALYFESKSDSKWHSQNLQFLFQHGRHYFYKEKEK